jgi:predicted ATPase
MLHQYQISNFKAFSNAETILLRPITLLYGPNSAGKSSVIQSLLLLKQTLQEAASHKTLLKSKGSLTNLGSYRDFIHLHDVNKKLKFNFVFDLDQAGINQDYRFISEILSNIDYSGMSIEFGYDSSIQMVIIASVELFVGDEDLPIATYSARGTDLTISKINSQHKLWKDWWKQSRSSVPRFVLRQANEVLQKSKIETIPKRSRSKLGVELENRLETLRYLLEELHQRKKEINQDLDQRREAQKLLEQELMSFRATSIDPLAKRIQRLKSELEELESSSQASLEQEEQEQEKQKQLDEAEEALQRMNELCDRLPFFVCEAEIKAKEQNKAGLINHIHHQEDYLGEMESLFQVYQSFNNEDSERIIENIIEVMQHSRISCKNFLPDSSNYINEYEVDDFSHSIYSQLFDLRFFSYMTTVTSSLVKHFLESISYIGPLRDYPERYYIFDEGVSEDVGKMGSGMANILFRDKEFLQQLNDQLDRFELGYELKIASFNEGQSSEATDVYALQLVDQQTQVQVNLLDVGFGISQVLPVIVQSMFACKKTIVIEQPEIHIHPRLQTELGSLFRDCIQPPFENQFIIETHSEHLMLRLQKLIRQGDLKAEDISVIYVDRVMNGGKCSQLRLDSEGDFIDEWPGGFFEEDFNEVFN